MSETIITKFICPSLGVIMANATFFAPIASLKEALQRGSLGDLNPLPWAFMTGNCVGWVIYSFMRKDLFLFIANAPGVFVSAYLNIGAAKIQYNANQNNTIDLTHEISDDVFKPCCTKQEITLFAVMLVWIIALAATFFIPLSQSEREFIVGIVVNVNLVVFFGAPLSTIVRVVNDRDSSSIHCASMLMCNLNCVFWSVYGLAVLDPIIYVPNLASLVLGLMQASLYLACPRNGKETMATNAKESDPFLFL